eukprot:NODE_6741_length_848_cov_44.046897_g6143_i0.p1 GENE.NODE_6741_length_848_cov_44.046897_g6143_i0~~NODE_6741_length_848_cov_44.046897_g6143_i0.p1  ORF type:complete len:241 (-),score=28.88 NODE_6741_length_848_cov_44.046897_g6143_i0:75-797(-)
MLPFTILLFFGYALGVSLDLRGAINLDSYTFDKIVGNDAFHVLVKFDKQYPYGEFEDQFKQLSKRVGELHRPDFLIAVVGVQDYGDKHNEDLRERYKVSPEQYPLFKLFKKGSTEPLTYRGDITADAILRFLKNEINLYIGLAGCLEKFDNLARGFAEVDRSEQERRLKEAEKENAVLTDTNEKDSASFYILVMKKILEKGNDYAPKERKRLEKLLDSKITEIKKLHIKKKLNILPSFYT